MREGIPDGICDLLFLQPRLGLGDGEVVALALVGGEHGEQHDGEHRENDGQQRGARLREGLVRRGRAGETHDLGVDGVVAEQRGGGHGAQTRDEGHDRQREHGGHERRENDLPENLEGLRAHVARGLDGVVVNAADGVAQEERVVARAGEGHGEEHRVEAREPVWIKAREGVDERGGENAVGGVEEQIARDQRDAGVDHRGHVAEAQDVRALDVEILRQQHDGHAHHIDRDDQADGELEGVPDVAAHAAREEEADDREGIAHALGVRGGEDARERIEARQEHEAEEEVGKEHDADHAHHKRRVEAGLSKRAAHHSTSSAEGA